MVGDFSGAVRSLTVGDIKSGSLDRERSGDDDRVAGDCVGGLSGHDRGRDDRGFGGLDDGSVDDLDVLGLFDSGLGCDYHVSSLDVNIGVEKGLTVLDRLGKMKFDGLLENVELAGATVLSLQNVVGLGSNILLGLLDHLEESRVVAGTNLRPHELKLVLKQWAVAKADKTECHPNEPLPRRMEHVEQLCRLVEDRARRVGVFNCCVGDEDLEVGGSRKVLLRSQNLVVQGASLSCSHEIVDLLLGLNLHGSWNVGTGHGVDGVH